MTTYVVTPDVLNRRLTLEMQEAGENSKVVKIATHWCGVCLPAWYVRLEIRFQVWFYVRNSEWKKRWSVASGGRWAKKIKRDTIWMQQFSGSFSDRGSYRADKVE